MAPTPATFRDVTSAGELMDRLHELAVRDGPVHSIRFFCGSREPDAILVLIDAGERSSSLASTLRGMVFGGVATCRVFPVGEDFRCGGRRQGRLIAASCDSCSFATGGGAKTAATPGELARQE